MIHVAGLPVAEVDARPAGFEGHGTGYIPRDYDKYPMNGQKFSAPLTIKAYTDQELKEIYAEQTANKSTIRDICEAAGLPPKDQGQSNYCWEHAPTHGIEMLLALMGMPVEILAAFYAAFLIKHGSNSGGSGIEAIEGHVEHGCCLEKFVPPLTFHPKITPEIQADAGKRKIITSADVDPHDHAMIRTRLAMRKPVTVGIPRWSHEIILCGYVWDGSKWHYVGRNSWGKKYGQNGYFILPPEYSTFDEAGSIESLSVAA